jgi:glycosyltransferase involved in cell wall biosynthesis
MRIAFISWRDLANDLAGGSEIFTDRLACSLLDMGHEVALLCGGPVGPRRYQVHDLGGVYTQYLNAPMVHRRSVKDWDLLVDEENGLPYFSPLWRRKPILGFMHHVHTDQWAQRFPPLLAAAGRLTEAKIMPRVYRRVPFIAVSPSTAAAMERIGIAPEMIHLLQPGVEVPPGVPADKSPGPLFVSVARLVPHKRVDLLLRVWERVRPAVGGRLVVIGDGPDREALEAQAGSDVVFTGRVSEDEKWRLFSEAWLLIHPAQHEGWGFVITEAAAVGTPSIGFDVPGVRDSILDGVSGVLVRSEDELTAQWIDLVADERRRGELSEGARERGSKFRWDEVAKEFSAIADEVVGSAGR